MNKKLRIIITLFLDAFIFIATIFSVITVYKLPGFGILTFRYFTVLSNIYCAICSVIFIVFSLLFLFKGKDIPKVIKVLKYSSAACVTLTFLTVMFFLGPKMGYITVLTGPNLFMHLLTPVVAIISLISICDRQRYLYSFFGFIPMLLYGIFYYIYVMKLGGPDFYMFLDNSTAFISALIMIIAELAICFILTLFINIIRIRGEKL